MSLKKQALSGIMWTFIEMFGGQLINFFVNIILARKLSPDNYGVIGMIYILVIISNTLMDSGLSPSLMRAKKLEDIDYSTTFVSQMLLSVLLYVFIFFVAPSIASFYRRPELIPIIRTFSLIIPIQASVQVQSIYLVKSLNFRVQTLIKLPAIILSSVVAIYLAYSQFGIWSLVWMYILQNFFWSLLHWVFGYWKFSFHFSKTVFKKHFKYGYKISIVEILNNITTNIYQIVLGKFYPTRTVGYYTQSLTLYQVPFSNIFAAIVKVLFPIFAEIQDDFDNVRKNFIKCQELLVIMMYPIFAFLFFNAEDVMVVVFSEKWRNAGVYLQFLCAASFFNIVTNWNIIILKLLKNSNKILKYEVVMKLLLFACIYIAVHTYRDINYLLLTIPIGACISMLYFSTKVCKMLDISLYNFLPKILIFLLLCFLPAFIVKKISFDNHLIELLLRVIVYLAVYGILIMLLKRSLILEFKKLLQR